MDDPGPSSAYYSTFPSTSAGPLRAPSPPPSPQLSTSPLTPEDGLYTLLNLPRSASEAEIRDSYRSLASTYHPDRQRDTAHRSTAHRQFTEIQRAYEVLTDPTRRTVYDLFGEEGLRTTWEVGPRIKTPQEMRDHFSRQYNAKKVLEAEALVKSKGDISVVLDARAVFARPEMFKKPETLQHDPLSRIKRLRVGQVSMKHSFELPVREKTQLVLTGQMVSRHGAGGGNVVGTIRHQFGSRVWGEVGSTLLLPRVITAKGTYTIDEYTYVTVNTLQQTFAAPPTFTAQFGRRIYPHTTGFIVYRSGFWTLGPWGKTLPSNPITAALQRDTSALSVGATTARQNGSGWTIETQAGIVANHISLDYSWRFWGLKWKVGGAVGTDTGINGFIDGESRVGTNTRVGCMVNLAVGGGVTMRWRPTDKYPYPHIAGSQARDRPWINSPAFHDIRCCIPFLDTPSKAEKNSKVSTRLTPSSYYVKGNKFGCPDPYSRIVDLRKEHADHLAAKRTEALEAQDLMARPVAAKVAAEREKAGLIIISAQYGLASAFTERGVRTSRSTGSSEKKRQGGENGIAGIGNPGEEAEEEEEVVVDVTVPLQSLVNDSRLYIPGGRGKHNILGFWDPCIGESKKLRVRYLFRNQLHEVTVDDTSSLRAPIRAHILEH